MKHYRVWYDGRYGGVTHYYRESDGNFELRFGGEWIESFYGCIQELEGDAKGMSKRYRIDRLDKSPVGEWVE